MKRSLKLITIFSILICCLCFSGCEKESVTITVTNYPVKYIIEQLVGDDVTVQYLGTEEFIQTSTIRSDYQEILENTTLFIYIGELEPYLDIFGDELLEYDFDIINLASLSAVDNFKRYTTTTVNEVSVTTESDYYDDSSFYLTDIYTKDPFIWLDPMGMSSMASTIKDQLEEYFPEDSLVIENNFKTLQASLVRLDAEYGALKDLEDVKIVTVAATFGNWQKNYGVEVYPLILSKYGALPTETQLAVIEEAIVENDVQYIVYDPTLSDEMQELYQRVKDDLDLIEIELSSLSILSEEDIELDRDYMTIMYNNLIALENAFK